MKLAQELKLKNAERDLIDACYYFQQYNSPRCWKSIEQAKKEYEKLKTKKDKLRYMKEQIQICSLGFGWKEAHHPWSCKGHVFDPDELFSHLVNVVIPMESTHPISSKLPVNLPQRPDDSTLEIKSIAVLEIDSSLAHKEKQIRSCAIKEWDRLEDLGYGDNLVKCRKQVGQLKGF
jgi:hypothetical protein